MTSLRRALDRSKGDPLLLGTKVKPWGTVSAVASLKGERYYFFTEKGVAMIPGRDVEMMYEKQKE